MPWRRSARCSSTRRPWYALRLRPPSRGGSAAAPAHRAATRRPQGGSPAPAGRWDGTQTHTEHVEYGIPAEVKVDDALSETFGNWHVRDDDRDGAAAGDQEGRGAGPSCTQPSVPSDTRARPGRADTCSPPATRCSRARCERRQATPGRGVPARAGRPRRRARPGRRRVRCGSWTWAAATPHSPWRRTAPQPQPRLVGVA